MHPTLYDKMNASNLNVSNRRKQDRGLYWGGGVKLDSFILKRVTYSFNNKLLLW